LAFETYGPLAWSDKAREWIIVVPACIRALRVSTATSHASRVAERRLLRASGVSSAGNLGEMRGSAMCPIS
jgi:hypothetical protein